MTVRFYNYYWGFTAAQIELMMSDLPLIIYPKSKKPARNGETGKRGFTTGKRVSDEEYGKEIEAWKRRMLDKPKGISLKRFKVGFNTKIGD